MGLIDFLATCDPALVAWSDVAAGALERRCEIECEIAQIEATVRFQHRWPTLCEQETLAALADNIDACDEVLIVVKLLGGCS